MQIENFVTVMGYMPAAMRAEFEAESAGKGAEEVQRLFEELYLNKISPVEVCDVEYGQKNGVYAAVDILAGGVHTEHGGKGNGCLDAICNAVRQGTGMNFNVSVYSEFALGTGSASQAIAFVGLVWGSGMITWGAGRDSDIMMAGVKALVSAINNKK